MKLRIFQILIIFSLTLFLFQINEINAQIIHNDEETQSILKCGEGTRWDPDG